MKKLFMLFLFFALFLNAAFAYNVREDSDGRPLYAADRIKVKLSEVASERLNEVLSKNDDFSNTGLVELDNLFKSIDVSQVKLAHRPVADKVWEQENGFNRWYLLFVPIGTDIETTIIDISSNEYIENAIPEYIFYWAATPNDPYFDECWGHDNTAQLPSYNSGTGSHTGPAVGTIGFDSHIEEAWDDTQGYGDSDIILAIIDSGVDYNHVDLNDNCVAGWDYGSGDNNPMDEYGHGTCCAGIAAAEVNNSIGVSGVAGNCKIMPLKISVGTGGPSFTAAANALTHCGDNNVDVASMSFSSDINPGDDPTMTAALEYAYDHGVTLLAATGNNNQSHIRYPANYSHVIAVGAASPCEERKDAFSCDGEDWWGSNYGVNTQDAANAVDVIAPTILPSTDITGAGGFSAGDYDMFFNGTSCATPYAAGVAALIKSKAPSLTPAEIRNILTSTATDVVDEDPTPGWDRYTGYGMVNADAAVGLTNTWTGNTNHYWGNSGNWSLGHIPDASEDVVIPNVNMPCIVDYSDKVCNSITIQSGATVEIQDQTLTVNGDATVHGTIDMLNTASRLSINNNIFWEAGSSASMTGSATIYVYGTWEFKDGAAVYLNSGYVDFQGSSVSYIRSKDADSYFHHIRNNKSSSYLGNSSQSNQPLNIFGNLYIYSGCELVSYSSQPIVITGFINNMSGSIHLDNGTIKYDGVGSTSNFIAGDYFNNLTISSSGTNTFDDDLEIKNDVLIESGVLNPDGNTLTVGGDWTNNVGSAGFTEGTGRVIFNGSSHQYVNSNETFNILEVDCGAALRVNNVNHTVTCNSYDWTSGGIDVISGTFTALDLVELGIYGGYWVNPGGTINLTNDSWVDLNGEFHNYGGTINVSGTISDWSYSGDAEIEMTDGVIDFKTCGINIDNNAHDLINNITGGTIRTAFSFTGDRSDFNPTGGTIELYGSTDATISMGAGSNFHDVLINKSAPAKNNADQSKQQEYVVVNNRDGTTTRYARSNTITAQSELGINGDFTIDAGTFDLNGFNVNISNHVRNYGSLIVAVDDTLDTGNDMYLYSGSTVNLSGTILLGTKAGMYGDAYHYSGSTFNQTDGDYYIERIYLYNGSQFNGTGGKTHIYANGATPASNNIEIDDPDSYFYDLYVDDGANAALNNCYEDLEVSHSTKIYAPLDINTYTMNSAYCDVWENGNLIIDDGGVVNVTGNGPYIHSLGTLTMAEGSELNSGLNIFFNTGSVANVSGGEIYLEGIFGDFDNIFNPTGGTVIFDGNGDSNVDGQTAFYNLKIDKGLPSVKSLNDKDIDGDFIVDSRISDTNGFDMNSSSDFYNRGVDKQNVALISSDGTNKRSSKANTVFLASDCLVTNDLMIIQGSLTLNGHELTVENVCSVYGTLNMTNVADVLNVGVDVYDLLLFYNGSTGNISAGNIYLSWGIIVYNGSSFTATTSNTIHYNSATYRSGIANDDPNTVFGNIVVDKSSGYFQLWNDGDEPIVVDGDLTLAAANEMETQDETLVVHGDFIDDAISEVYVYNYWRDGGEGVSSADKLSLIDSGVRSGSLEIDTDFTLDGLMDVGDGNVLIHGLFELAATGTLTIDGGSFVCDAPYSKSSVSMYGTMNLSDGIFEISNNHLAIKSSFIENITGGTIRCGASFVANHPHTFQPENSTFETINKVSGTYLTVDTTNCFNNFVVNCTNPWGIYSPLYITDNVTIDNGTVYLSDPSDGNLFVGGDWTNNVGTTGFNPNTRTVTFYGPNESDITTDETFYNMALDKPMISFTALEINSNVTVNVTNDLNIIDGTIEMNDNSTLNIGNDLNIDLDAALNCLLDIGLNVNIAGDWNDLNPIQEPGKGFDPGTNTVTFNGSVDQYMTTSSPAEEFYNLVIDKSAGEFKPNNNTEIFGDLDILNGAWDDDTFGLTHNIYGDVYVASTGDWYGSGCTVAFKGDADQTFEFLTNSYLTDVIVDKSPVKTRTNAASEEGQAENDSKVEIRGQTVILNSDLLTQAAGTLLIEEGTLNLNGHAAGNYGDIIINDGGKIEVDEDAELRVGDGYDLIVNSGGILEVLGSPGHEAMVTNFSIYDNYDFNVLAGGTIAAEHAVFEYTGFNGVFVDDGGIVDGLHPFNYCTFQHGSPIPGSAFLVINNDQDLTITGAHFPDNTSANYNVAKDDNQGTILMNAATGVFEGESYEWDPYGLITWLPSVLPPIDDLTITYTPTAKGTIELNWTYSTVVDSFFIYRDTDPYFIPGTPYASVEGTTYTWSEPATGAKYFYIVTAFNNDVPVAKSNTNRSRNDLRNITR